ncbi:hypothetical protein [Roseibium aestuarii]|uniref:Uncharacterized protein n=1 Tax=Roseibium aestuarii TaxID=2600299 RepID=A0ABW4K1E1_9HYPH|nr:hypothetical protein [Roseibium aestuarii]
MNATVAPVNARANFEIILSKKSMTSIFETYAAKICRCAELPPNTYDIIQLNRIVMTLPLAEAHAALDGVEHDRLPRLGDTVSLKEHMQANFFDILNQPARELWEFTKPILMKRQHLERLEGWRDWRTLSVYLSRDGLEPSAVFRNTPIPIKTDPFESVDYYVADIRVFLVRDISFVWSG